MAAALASEASGQRSQLEGCARRALALNRARRRARDKPGHDDQGSPTLGNEDDSNIPITFAA
jgi:hypothetical protein